MATLTPNLKGEDSIIRQQSNASTHNQAPSSRKKAAAKAKRASHACMVCRQRKVRCDVSERSPCGNCHWSGEPCVVPRRRNERRKWRSSRQLSKKPTEAKSLDGDALGSVASGSSDVLIPWATTPPSSDDVGVLGEVKVEVSHKSSSRLPVGNPHQPTSSVMAYAPPREALSPNPRQPPDMTELPQFIQPSRVRLDGDDLEFLTRKRAFELPETTLRTALLCTFFDHVYPLLPTLDLDSFLLAVSGESTEERISLVVFQAVLAAGTCYVDMDYLRRSGYSTRGQAQDLLFKRAQLLHDFNYESNHVALAQASLLLTFWCRPEGEHKNMRYWADVAISHVLEAGINLESTTDGLSRRQRGLLRRLWWCCFMRDRLISLETNRMPRISDADFNILILVEEDFSIVPSALIEASQPQVSICSYAAHLEQRRKLARLCIAQLSLCQSLTHVFRLHNIVANMRKDAEKDHDHRDRREKHDLAFVSCIRDLLQWQKSLPRILAYQPVDPNHTAVVSDLSLAVGRAAMHRSYDAAFESLYRSRLWFLHRNTAAWSMENEMRKIFMEYAAQRVLGISSNLDEYGARGPPQVCTDEGLTTPVNGSFAAEVESQSQDAEETRRESTDKPQHDVTPSSSGIHFMQTLQTTLPSLTQLERESVPTAVDSCIPQEQAVLGGEASLFGCSLGVEPTVDIAWTWDIELGGSPMSHMELLDQSSLE